jgi:hypothetical protein
MNFPQRHVTAVQDMAARLFDSRKTGADLATFARDLIRGLEEVCERTGLDAIELDADTGEPALVAQLKTIDLDGGGPRNAKPRQLAECVFTATGITVVEEPDRTISLGGDVRSAVVAAITEIAEAELALPRVRETIIEEARTRTDERFHPSFTKVVAQLDDRGAHLVKTPKVPVDALHAVQHALTEARHAVIARIVNAGFERAKALLGDEAAARIDQPITRSSTPRELAILRANEARVGLTPAKVVHSLVESLTDLAQIVWRAPEQPVQPYGASKTFKVGDLIEHPKFGRGTVVAALAQKIDVEFTDGKRALAHVPPRR